MDTVIGGTDPVLALQTGMRALERQSGPLDWSQYQVTTLAEVETFIFLAKGADGKEVSGLLIRPLMNPDMLLTLTDLVPVGREITERINARLPAPRAPQKAPPKQAAPVFQKQHVLPPTPGQGSIPGELAAQGEALVQDAERRLAEKMLREQGSVPGSTVIAPPVVYPPGSAVGRSAAPTIQIVPAGTQSLPPDLDDVNIPQD
jgi:hypothetical protein